MSKYGTPAEGTITPRAKVNGSTDMTPSSIDLDPLDEYANSLDKPTVAQNLPADLYGAEPPVPPTFRRSVTTPYMSSTSDHTSALHPPAVDPSQSTNILTRYLNIKGDGLVLFVTCFASLGVFMFGYDQGVMSGILTHPAFKAYFDNPTASQVGTMVAILEIGALITSLLSGIMADPVSYTHLRAHET